MKKWFKGGWVMLLFIAGYSYMMFSIGAYVSEDKSMIRDNCRAYIENRISTKEQLENKEYMEKISYLCETALFKAEIQGRSLYRR